MNMRNCMYGAAALGALALGLYALGGSAALLPPLVLLACPLMMMAMMAGMYGAGHSQGRAEGEASTRNTTNEAGHDHPAAH